MERTLPIDPGEEMIDIRDLIERFEELETDSADIAKVPDDDKAEFDRIKTLLDDLKGNGGDHKWRGAWYPLTLILDDYFEDYAKQLAEDIGAIPRDLDWPACHIDWDAAADSLKMDYATVEYSYCTYYYR